VVDAAVVLVAAAEVVVVVATEAVPVPAAAFPHLVRAPDVSVMVLLRAARASLSSLSS